MMELLGNDKEYLKVLDAKGKINEVLVYRLSWVFNKHPISIRIRSANIRSVSDIRFW